MPCRETEVIHHHEISGIITDVLSWFSTVIGVHSLNEIKVRYGALEVPHPNGGTLGWTNAQWVGSKGMAEILTVPYVPTSALHQILAHEFGHVVLIFDPLKMSPHQQTPADEILTEGVCEVFAHEYLLTRPEEQCLRLAKRIERNPHPVYGDGYRAAAQLLEKQGELASLLSLLTGWVEPATHEPIVRVAQSSRSSRQPFPPQISISPPSDRISREHRPIIEMNPRLVQEDSPQPTSSRPVIKMKKPT